MKIIKPANPLPEEVGFESDLYGVCPEGQMIALLLIADEIVSRRNVSLNNSYDLISSVYGVSRSQMQKLQAFKDVQTPEIAALYKSGKCTLNAALILSVAGTGTRICKICHKEKDLGEYDYGRHTCRDCERPIKNGKKSRIQKSETVNQIIRKHNEKRVLSRHEEAMKVVSGMRFMIDREKGLLAEMLPTLTKEEIYDISWTMMEACQSFLQIFCELLNYREDNYNG